MTKAKPTTRPLPVLPAAPEPGSPLAKASFRQMTSDELENLAFNDPEKAETYLNLYEKLAKRREKESEEGKIIRMAIDNLKVIQRQAEIEYARQKACGQGGHKREDNRSALVGQRDNYHELLLVCQRCQQHYHGIGNDPGMLPIHLAETIDTSLIGGVQ